MWSYLNVIEIEQTKTKKAEVGREYRKKIKEEENEWKNEDGKMFIFRTEKCIIF